MPPGRAGPPDLLLQLLQLLGPRHERGFRERAAMIGRAERQLRLVLAALECVEDGFQIS